MKIVKKITALSMAAALFAVSCKDDDTMEDMGETTIYQDLGGNEMVADPNNSGQLIEQGFLTLRSVVDSTIFVIAGDNNLAPYFGPLLAEVGNGNTSGFAALSASLTTFFASATGGDFQYTGLNMTDAHKVGTNNRNQFLVNDAAFSNFVGAVVAGAGQNGVASDAPVIGRLGELLETLREPIVQTDLTVEQQSNLYMDLGGSMLADDPNNPGTQIETGYLTIRSVVDSAIFVIAGDERLAEYFAPLLNEVGAGNTTGLAALSKSLSDFFAYSSGATNPAYHYNGLDMVAAHNPQINSRMGLAADNAAYDAFIEDVVAGAVQNGVPADAQVVADLGALIESLRGEIVQR